MNEKQMYKLFIDPLSKSFTITKSKPASKDTLIDWNEVVKVTEWEWCSTNLNSLLSCAQIVKQVWREQLEQSVKSFESELAQLNSSHLPHYESELI